MTECPRCREAIKEDATKCPHCGADLLARGAAPGDVILVVDRGLVHFGKFALALFGLFFVFGVVFFGLDLKNLSEEIEERRTEMDVTKDSIKELVDDMEDQRTKIESTEKELVSRSTAATASVKDLEKQVTDARKDVEARAGAFKKEIAEARAEVAKLKASVKEAEDALGRIRAAEKRARVLVSNMLVLPAEEIEAIQATAEAGESVAPAAQRNPKLFEPGQRISVAFVDEATPEIRAAVEAAIAEWKRYVNLDFQFVDEPSEAIVRIGLRPEGSWAFVGRDAVNVVSPDQPTVNFGWNITAPDQHDTVLSEFGHVLGFPNEHSNPRNGIVWNEEAVYEHFTSPPTSWSRDMVDHNILRKLPLEEYPCLRDFDPDSIMMYAFPAGLTADGKAITPAPGLSESDKLCAAEMYPR